jgi:hypothetical protein
MFQPYASRSAIRRQENAGAGALVWALVATLLLLHSLTLL